MTAPESTPRLPLVVCVDDDEDLLAAVVRSLRSLPIEILATNDPRQALQYVKTRDVAVLLSDVEMPEMTGIELTTAARRVRSETVRILMTGLKSLDVAAAGINQGEVFRYVQKPFVARALCKVMEEALAHHVTLSVSAHDRERVHLRAQLCRELEVEFPGITTVPRGEDGAYLVSPVDRVAVWNAGLGGLADLAHR